MSNNILNFSSMNRKDVKVYRANQQGAALIVVLLFLILIMLAGVMAVRQSNTDLKTATADQINTALLQSSDSANQKLEATMNSSTTNTSYGDAISATGVFGSFMLNPTAMQGGEYIYCYNPRNNQYNAKYATIKVAGGGTLVDNGGVCDYTNADDYTSARQTTLTQVSVTTTPPSTSTEVFSQMVNGQDSNSRTSQKYHFDIRATSLLPAYNEPTGCLSQSSIPVTTGTGATAVAASPILDCLHNKNTPSKMLYEQADLQDVSSSTTCIPFGKGAGSISTACVLATS